MLNNSQLMPKILNSPPILSDIVSDTSKTIDEMYDLVDKYIKDKDKDKFNKNTIDIMLKNKIISVEYVEELIKTNKLKTDNLDEILKKYN